MPLTTNMQLDKPTVLTTPGPDYANMLNTIVDKIDQHDHTTNAGVKINQAGLNFNGDIPANGQTIVNLKAAQYDEAGTIPLLNRAVFVYGGDLYYRPTTGGGSVQLTSGTAVSAASGTLKYKLIATMNYTLLTSDANYVLAYSYTGFPKLITMPAASTVGVFYLVIRDIGGDAGSNPISLVPNGADKFNNVGGANFAAVTTNGGVCRIISDGISKWWTI